MTKSKIVTEKQQLLTVDGDGYSYCCSGGGGNGFGDSNNNGYSRSDGYSYNNGNGRGCGNIGCDDKRTEITDPMSLQPLRFFSQTQQKFVNWDDIWDECNDEQKQHLLLFLPLRGN